MATAPRSDLDVFVNGHDNLTPALNKSLSSIIRWVGAVSSALAAVEVVAFPIKEIRAYQRELANVQKTTGFTDIEIAKLSGRLKALSLQIDISATDLAKISAAAGQQGLGREGVEGIAAFTDSVARMSSVLDISVEEAGAAVGKLASIFKVPLVEMERLISGFNEVANNSTATGDELIDVVRRIGDGAGALKNYADTLGLAATGIDFGLSPEVVGTSFTKIFADMQSKASKFGALLGMDTKEWLTLVQTNGIEALKVYTERLRELEGESRQAQIRELSGTGRIGALINKLVADTTNSVLDKNLSAAWRGVETGTSALREQATVMRTLDSQSKVLANAFTNLGKTAGEQFVGPLTAYVVELREALTTPAFEQFAASVGQAFLGVFDHIATLIKFLASLNVDWGNLITLAEVLVSIKLAKFFASLVIGLTPLSGILKSVSKDAEETGKKLADVGNVKTGTIRGYVDELGKVTTGYREMRAAAKEVEEAEKALQAAQMARDKATSRSSAIAMGKRMAMEETAPQRDAVRSAASAGTAAVVAGRRLEEREQQRYNASVLQKQTAHNAKMVTLETEFAARRAAARAAGDTAALRQLTAARTAEERRLQESYERSLRSTQAYHQRRLAIIREATATETAAHVAALQAAQSRLTEAERGTGVVAITAAQRKDAAEISRLDKGVRDATANLDAAKKAAEGSSKAFLTLANGVSLLRSSFGLLLGILSKATIWLTLGYMLADMFGIVDKLGGAFQSLTDAIGLTSAASRKSRTETAEKIKQERELQQEIANTIQKYRDRVEFETGQLAGSYLDSLPVLIGGENVDASNRALSELVENLRATLAIRDQAALQSDTILIDADAEKQALEKAKADLQKALADRQAAISKMAAAEDAAKGDPRSALLRTPEYRAQATYLQVAESSIEKLTSDIQKMESKLSEVPKNMENLAQQSEKATEETEKLLTVVSGLFTQESAEIFKDYAPKLLEIEERLKEAEAAYESANLAMANAQGDPEALALASEAFEEALGKYSLVQGEITATRKEMSDLISQMVSAPGMSEASINSLEYLKRLAGSGADAVRELLRGLNMAVTAGRNLTGAFAPAPAPLADGDESYDGKGGAGARKESKARLALTKAQAEAELRLLKDANKERLSELEHTNARGLVSIKDFYARKKAIQEADLDGAIRIARHELEANMQELNEAKDTVSRLQAQASVVRVQGEIDALLQQRSFLSREIAREQENALRDFNRRLAGEQVSLAQSLGNVSDQSLFEKSLRNYQNTYEDFLNRLRSEAESMPELLPVIADLEESINLQAVQTVFQQIGREADLSRERLTLYTDQIRTMSDSLVIGSSEALVMIDRVRVAQTKLAETEVRRLQEAIAGAREGTLAYQELALELERAQGKLVELRAKGNETALEINQIFQRELGDFFATFKWGDGLGDSLRDMFNGIIDSLRQTTGDLVAGNLMSWITDLLGGEGIGGALAGAMGVVADNSTPTPVRVVNDIPGLTSVLGGAAGMAGGITEGMMAAINKMEDPIGGLIDALDTSSSVLPEGMMEATGSFLTGLGDKFSGLLDSLGSLLGSMGSSVGGWLGSLFGPATVAHTGATIGGRGGSTRMVPMGMFANAPRYHGGTMSVGLKPNEVPAVLEKGETVRTEQQEQSLQRRLRNSNSSGGDGDGIGQVNVWVVTPDQMEGQGMSENDVIATVASNIDRNGSLRRLIATIPRRG